MHSSRAGHFQAYLGARTNTHSSVWNTCLPFPLSDLQAQWLPLPGSLTRALRALGAFHLEILHEGCAHPNPDEAQALGIGTDSQCWLREVLMSVDGTHAVIGRSLTPDIPDAHAWRDIRTLSDTPLGVLLYEAPRITRTPFAYARPGQGHPLAELAGQVGLLLARRSVFRVQQEPLLVAECFLPGLWEVAGRRRP
ncbi:chorismate--pyruvate lyase family protein [Kerstersia gyiorum]|uniref:chorismate--pyruvate lyase family protein n=1 Tax=Kerstersia gyiorum TaxID=206506 RepID=UPI00142F93FA|nr:chorismate lyase [Kerstersia gyiorum]